MNHLKSHFNKKLFTHLENSAKLSKEIIKSKKIENEYVFSNVAYLNGVAHDFAKSTTFFQDWLENHKRSEKSRHGHLSSIFGYYLIKRYLEQNDLLERFSELPAISFVVINKHHGNLINVMGGSSNLADKIKDRKNRGIIEKQVKDIKENHLDEIRSIYDELLSRFDFDFNLEEFLDSLDTDFYREIRKKVKDLSKDKKIDNYVNIMFFYSVLLDADKLDASEIEKIPSRWQGTLDKKIVDDYKEAKFGEAEEEINKIREEAYEDVNDSIDDLDSNDRILSINLPTGSGKTLTALSSAIKLRNKIKENEGFEPKIIYSLPFLSIIDQNSSVFREVLADKVGFDWDDVFEMGDEEKDELLKEEIPSNLLLTHHHLADVKYKEKIDENETYDYEDLLDSLLLTEGWYSEIVVSTFVQLFHSLITNKNRSARKFHNITNSIIVLDEVQSIPFEYWKLVNRILTILSERFNCWVLFMTATKPLIFDEEEMIELATAKKEYFEFFDRIKYGFDLQIEKMDEIEDLILNEKDKTDIMVVMNTVNSCKEVYNDLKNHLKEDSHPEIDENGICQFENRELINLSTHILPSTRMERINHIKTSDKQKIIVTTQLIEAGVDISVDLIYRDLAPLDSIIQTAGRCNREGDENLGFTRVIKLKDENSDRNKDFHSYIYDPTIIGATRDIIDKSDKEIREKEFNLKGANNYFEMILQRKAQDKEVLNDIKKLKFIDVSDFDLIEEDVESISLYVERDEEAKELRRNLEEELSETKGIERKKKFLKWRKDLNEYMLSVRGDEETINKIEDLDPFIGNESIRVISDEVLEDWFDDETGFKIPDSTIDSRLI